MKLKSKLQRWLPTVACAFVLTGVSVFGQATDLTVNTFDTTSEGNWFRFWGLTNVSLNFDASQDANNNSGSGSLKFTIGWNDGSADTNQFAFGGTFQQGSTWMGAHTIPDFTVYSNLLISIKWDPTSVQIGGDYGPLEIGLVRGDYSSFTIATVHIPTTVTGWTNIDIVINPTTPGLTNIGGLLLKMWAPGTTGTNAFWVDNIKVIARTVPVPPPDLGLVKAAAGLKIFADQKPNYNRWSLRTVTNANNLVSFYGQSSPVTYSFNIAQYADSAHSGFGAHILIAPGAEPSSDPDWTAVNCIYLDIVNGGTGGASANIRYKTNQPASNTMMYNSQPTNGPVGNLAFLNYPSPLGTWSMTFTENTNITISGPGGLSTNVTITPDVAALFADPVSVYFGIRMNNDNNVGQSATISHVQISGVGSPVDEHFSSPTLDTNHWYLHPQAGGDLQAFVIVPATAEYWLNWSLPADGFQLTAASGLLDPPLAWLDVVPVPTVNDGSREWGLVGPANLPATPNAFFRMIKRSASKLQVLLPGETAAPGTLTGKTGTPTNPGLSSMFDVIVNAVDDTWHVVNSVNDSIVLSSTDPVAGFPPDPVSLSNGTYTYSTAAGNGFYFGSAGTWTITATDVTDPAKAPGVSSPVNVH